MRSERVTYATGGFLVFVALLAFSIITLSNKKAEAQKEGSPALRDVIEGAKKEGVLRLQWLSGNLSDAGLRAIVAAMNRRYKTNIRLEFTPGPDMQQMYSKITQEKASRLASSTDVNLMTGQHVARSLKVDLWKRVDWDAILERPAPTDAIVNRVAPEGVAMMIGSAVVGITYNTNLIKGSDIPVSMEDVFKPKWQGKIASTPYATGLYHFAAPDMLGYDYMKNYTQRLAKHIGGLFSCTDVPRISSGEFLMMVFDCGSYSTLQYKKRGAPVDSTPIKEATRINYFYMGVPVHATHPNAGTLLIAFLHTREAQDLLWESASLDLHFYPETHSRKVVLKAINAGTKVMLDTAERHLKIGTEELVRINDEFIKILREGGR